MKVYQLGIKWAVELHNLITQSAGGGGNIRDGRGPYFKKKVSFRGGTYWSEGLTEKGRGLIELLRYVQNISIVVLMLPFKAYFHGEVRRGQRTRGAQRTSGGQRKTLAKQRTNNKLNFPGVLHAKPPIVSIYAKRNQATIDSPFLCVPRGEYSYLLLGKRKALNNRLLRFPRTYCAGKRQYFVLADVVSKGSQRRWQSRLQNLSAEVLGNEFACSCVFDL